MTRIIALCLMLFATPAWAAGAWSPGSIPAGSCSTFTWTSTDAGDAQPPLLVLAGELAITAEVTSGTPSVAFYLIKGANGSDTPASTGTLAYTATATSRSPTYVSVGGGYVLDPDINAAGAAGGTVTVCSSGYASGRRYHGQALFPGPSGASIQAAIDAACSAGSGLVIAPQGQVAITTQINLNCDLVELRGNYYGTELLVTAGITGIKVTGDWIKISGFRFSFTGSNAANIGIDMDNNASTVSRWTIEDVKMVGQADTGIGIRCEFCMKGKLSDSQIQDFQYGFFGLTTPNANTIISSTFSLNDNGVYISDTMSSTLSLIGDTFESNDIDGVYCASNGAGIIVSHGSHYEANAAGLHRPASGCGFVSLGDTFSSNTDDYLKDSSGGTDDVFLGSYLSAGSLSAGTSEIVPLLFPANSILALPLDPTVGIIIDELVMVPTVATASSSAITNTTTETAFSNCNVASLPGNGYSVGTTLRITAGGTFSDDAITPGTMTMRARWGTANTDPLIADLGPGTTLILGATSDGWTAQVDFTIRTLGASGTLVGGGNARFPITATAAETLWDNQAGTTTIDTTTAKIPTLFAKWSVADTDNTITAEYCTVEVLRQ